MKSIGLKGCSGLGRAYSCTISYIVNTRVLILRHLYQNVETSFHIKMHGLTFIHLDQYLDTWDNIQTFRYWYRVSRRCTSCLDISLSVQLLVQISGYWSRSLVISSDVWIWPECPDIGPVVLIESFAYQTGCPDIRPDVEILVWVSEY